jgi:hypothetical protein
VADKLPFLESARLMQSLGISFYAHAWALPTAYEWHGIHSSLVGWPLQNFSPDAAEIIEAQPVDLNKHPENYQETESVK